MNVKIKKVKVDEYLKSLRTVKDALKKVPFSEPYQNLLGEVIMSLHSYTMIHSKEVKQDLKDILQ